MRLAGFSPFVILMLLWLPGSLMAHQTGGESQKREADTDSGPRLASVNAAVAVAGDNKLIFGKNADRSVPIASVTKVMTALVVLESGEPLDEWLTFHERHTPAAANAYSRIRIDSEMRRKDVLRSRSSSAPAS